MKSAKGRDFVFKPSAEFKPFYLGISMISTAEAKKHPDDIQDILF